MRTMKRIFSSALLLSAALLVSTCKSTELAVTHANTQQRAPYQAARTKHHDLLHTKLEVNFDWQHQRLHGVAMLKLQPHCFPQRSLVLDAQGFIVHSVAMLEAHKQSALKYTYDGKKLTIDLGRTLYAEETYFVEIAYTAQASTPRGEETGLGSRGLFFVNATGSDSEKPQQIWTQGEPQTNSCWFPTIDAPNQRCTQEVYITVDKRFQTLSNGVLGYSKLNEDDTRTDYWHMDLPHAPYLFMLAVGEFAVVQDAWGDVEVNYYVEPTYEKYASTIFGHTPEMIEFFSQKLAYPYPWPKYSQVVVRDYMAGAMENTSAVVFADMLQVDDRQLLDRDYDDIIAHELFHHWFGDLVTCESWSQLPLNESFACLGAHIWREHKYVAYAGDLSLWNTLQGYLQEASHKQVNLIRFHYGDAKELFDRHSYNKGSLVLHMLRQHLGEEVFFNALNYYLKKHAFSSTEIHQLRKAFEDVTGQDLNWFFNQWFFAAGHPILKVAHTYTEGKLTLKVWQQQDVQTTPIYRLPLTVTIGTESEQQYHKIVVEDQYSEFTWELPQPPALVSINRNSILLGVIEHPKSTAEYQHLYYQGEDFFAKHEALIYCIKNIHKPACCQVLQDALKDDFWFFRKMAADAFKSYRGKDLAVVASLLIELSKSDEKSAVSAAAVRTLASLQNPAQYIDVYKQGMTARSYQLAGIALYAYATTTNEPDKPTHLAKFESHDKPEIIVPLSNYYIQTRTPGKYAWLKQKLIRLRHSASVCQLITALGKYLTAVADKESQKDGLELLKKMASETKSRRIRSAIQEALQSMQHIKDASTLLNKLKAEQQSAK